MLSTVLAAYSAAWKDRSGLVVVYLGLALLALALIGPLVGGAINLAVSMSGQTALTDQDIAGFLLSPAGFVLGIVCISLVLLTIILSFAVMTVRLWQSDHNGLAALRNALGFLLSRWRDLLTFAIYLVVRVLIVAMPFAVVILLIAAWQLSAYDINYYLTEKPPEFIGTLAIGGLLILGLVVILFNRLTAWALALHFVLFEGSSVRRSFSLSEDRMGGQRVVLVRDAILWLIVRALLLAAVALVAALLMHTLPLVLGQHLRAVLAGVMILAALWWLARTVVAAISLGALAQIIFDIYAEGQGMGPPPPRAAAPGGASLPVPVLLGGIGVLVLFGLIAGGAMINRVQGTDDVIVIAHRGAAGSRPENTLASLQKAVKDKADWVEIDVQETADGEVVVMHDSDFMKLSGVDLKIWEATMDDLAGIDIGSWFDPAYAGERTPTLAEALAVTKDKARLLIELKYYGHDQMLEQRVADIVSAAGMDDQVAAMSLKYPAVQMMHSLRPNWPIGVLAATAVGDLTGLEGNFIAVSTAQASRGLAKRADEAGKALYVWTVDDPLQMSSMITMGARGLITDEPALAREVLNARADMSTAQRVGLLLADRLGVRLQSTKARDDSP
ncbi:MAG: glycerophosphodiester phosphodiesterase family protein [Pseudomonadota bacterium]